MRRPWLFAAALVVLGLLLLAAYPALAVPPPHANAGRKPPQPTPTTAATPTTTTLPATTTTAGAMPTTTTTTIGTCQAPLVISTGGTYSGGCYESASSGTPAIRIATTQAVTLDGVLIRHKGVGIYAQTTTGTNVTVTNSTFQALNPNATVEQHAVYLRQPATFTFDHNRLLHGHGVLLAGEDVATTQLRIRFNDFLDVGRYPASYLISAVQFDKVAAPRTS